MILALDLSTKSTGWAVFSKDGALQNYGCITAGGTDMIGRIKRIMEDITDLINRFKITELVIEEVRIETGIQNATYKALMYMQAAIMFLIHDDYPSIEITFFQANSWRKRCGIKTGRGIKRNELKKADIDFVNKTYSLNVSNDDIADAIGIGHAYVNSLSETFDW